MSDNMLFDLDSEEKKSGPVKCLGREFENDEARRAHFIEELRKKLQDPEFRKIEGFPNGSDEDILNLSDPPYYTACPNPWIGHFIAEWEALKPKKPDNYSYHREPFAADVSEGKYDPIYKYHPYPTKVPHKAIMRYILHYTKPGDIVFDGFCGTGMTGVAAQMCGDRDAVISLGYQVKQDGSILREEIDETGIKTWVPFSQIGIRRVVLNDLSPAGTFVTYNYNTPINISSFEKTANRILKEIENECSWMYTTKHSDGRLGTINYTVWSDVFVCQECSGEVVFWNAAVDKEAGKVRDEFSCPHCSSSLTKRSLDRAWITFFDPIINQTQKQAKQVPVLINYSVGSSRHEKVPDQYDIDTLKKLEDLKVPYWFPSERMIFGKETRRNDPAGLTHIHHFYSKRNLYALAKLKSLSPSAKFNLLITKVSFQITKLYRFTYQSGVWGAGGGPLSGTLYVPSLVKELNIIKQIKDALKQRRGISHPATYGSFVGSTQSSSWLPSIPDNSLSYIFIDPPFGANLYYSELAFLWETWLRILTNNKEEAIENDAQGKGLDDYRLLMQKCFSEAYRALKPGRWMTIEFSNTKASVWNSIQTALLEAGFLVANVSALDKKKGSFKAVTTPTAVKQDLVISAYKPNGGFEERFSSEANTEDGVWDFVRTHLKYLPVIKKQAGELIIIPERDPRILFDQMVAYYVRKGYPVPISSQEFQLGLRQRFAERDGMFFLPEQAAEYDKKRLTVERLVQRSLFVFDESSAIEWLRSLLREKPQTFQDLHPQFLKEIGGWSKNEKALELSTLLEQNFLRFDGRGEVPSQIHSYLSTNWPELRNRPKDDPALVMKARDRWYVPDPNKAGDLEKLREKALLKEFEEYKQVKKKLKVFRLEAVRAGFKSLWQLRTPEAYKAIIEVAEKIPSNVLEEDPKLLMWYDQAITRSGGEIS
ncbi:MAG: site-specific DNA-methyltransferase [Pseudodesulfovibrio sp.]|uniref:DNA methylase N-4/N-6 domain protein n=1 Tax=Pseudodesulfovibrio aespoeensis (strain ATCC 700646 / DSM 10631 / Aspo-2) TaxID=643562 RepID=E6VXW1_PSEA9|nr:MULTISPECIES: DNA methyltransferase [Pseudodesulfovibrio]ADU62668.1 DNA methylase N-4/N-6 domain protein [Pseudodesulfovibrio aespoeensis Aspo-2]MBV1763445.1 site-specific DNA-methyltransferase [Pseudodesulfovibrio sp.]MBV1772481.1 site-specific DNA-methyltransferase [Pseudodesulfovibrio sp.]